MKHVRLNYLVLAFCFLPFTVFATTIVVFVTPVNIFIAADGMESTMPYNEGSVRTVCKINVQNNIVFTAGGIIGLTDRHPLDMIKEEIKKNIYLSDSFIQKISNILTKELLKKIAYNKDKSIESYILREKTILSTVLCGVVNGVPTAYITHYLCDYKSKKISIAIEKVATNVPRDRRIIVLGSRKDTAATNKYNAMRLKFKEPRQARDICTDIIRITMKTRPQEVGEPVNVVEVWAKKIVWDNSLNCK